MSKKATKKSVKKSGPHKNHQRLLSQPQEDWDEQDAYVASLGITWATWIRELAAKALGKTKK